MKRLIALVFCVGIMCAATLQARNTFVREIDGYKVEVKVKFWYEGWIENTYQVDLNISREDNRVNLCAGTYSCWRCPNLENQWVVIMSDIDFVCSETSPRVEDLFKPTSSWD